MRFVFRSDEDPGMVDLNFMWLPTFIGMNAAVKAELQGSLNKQFAGQPLTEDVLDEMHETVIELLVRKFSFAAGLREYLHAVRSVRDVQA